MNGSSATGHCSNITENGDGTSICLDPTSSVLFDGNIPTLTGLDGDMWASQLLTIRSGNPAITVDFSATENFRLRRVEMVVFNCEELGPSFESANLEAFDTLIALFFSSIASCDSLLRVCTGGLDFTETRMWLLRYVPISVNDWVHIAEITFHGDSPTCPPNTIITAPAAVTTPVMPMPGRYSTGEIYPEAVIT